MATLQRVASAPIFSCSGKVQRKDSDCLSERDHWNTISERIQKMTVVADEVIPICNQHKERPPRQMAAASSRGSAADYVGAKFVVLATERVALKQRIHAIRDLLRMRGY